MMPSDTGFSECSHSRSGNEEIMFKKILIANRGEIAMRVIHTCREMGIDTVAVCSDADKKAAHVLAADETVYLGPSEPSESYLNMGRIIAAVKKSGAEAVHPGYGFLAENADFAGQCQDEGIVFIGPPPDVIRKLGDKIASRQLMVNGGVPVTPGLISPAADMEEIRKEASHIAYPVLIKAAAGGGGKGIRMVNAPDELDNACRSAASEAKAAFGDGTIYMEKFLPKSRHVEVQILADTHGNIIHLLERECSIQRRHQKIVEETPSPVLTPALREEMGQAAVTAARVAGYVNAGTVEFILDQNNKFYFLEVNTRLQVEHPVTEMITGIDIVRHQIEIAAGNPLPFSQADIMGRGHAVECRIYAEDPENHFLPCPGEIRFLQEPSGPGIRNDCGVYSGFEVPVEYDPILSKLVAYGENREQAVRRMIRALQSYTVIGIRTPIPFLIDVLQSEPFSEGETYTDFIDTHFRDWTQKSDYADLARISFVVDELTRSYSSANGETLAKGSASPWQTLGNWRH